MKLLPNPTVEDWAEGYIESVLQEIDNSYRHGCYVYEVFHRDVDDTYWSVSYKESGDGEENSLRDGEVKFSRVFKQTRVVTEIFYTSKP